MGQQLSMSGEQAIARLREHQAELTAGGILRLSLFGSTARGDRRPDSDIDLLATFDETRRISLLDVAGLEVSLSEMLGCPVELVEERSLKLRVRRAIEPEVVRVF
jgi:hypothetical protein